MEQSITIAITTEHMKKSHGYIFDDCPLKLAIQDKYPDAISIIVGGPKVIITLSKKDTVSWVYAPSANYGPAIDKDIAIVKKAGEDFHMEVTLSLTGTQFNYHQYDALDDHVVQMGEVNPQIPPLPEDLFAD